MLAIFQKEIGSFFNSLIAYIVMAVFLIAVGLIVWVFPDSNVLDYGYADLGSFFYLSPYVLLFLIPAITMRSFSEEMRSGTLELLLTKPLSITSLVIGKFLANWTLVLITLLPTTIYYYSIYHLGNPVGNVDSAAVVGSYIGLILLSGSMVGFGILASSLNDNQIVGFVIGVFFGFLWYVGFGALAAIMDPGIGAKLLSWLALDMQYRSLGIGLIDLGSVVYQISLILFLLYLTITQIQNIRR